MITRTVKVTKAETLPTKDGKKTYLSVVLSDGNRDNKYSIFDPALQKTLQDAHKSGESVSVGLEKEGNFWNIKSAEVTTEEVQATTEPKSSGQRFYHDRHSQDAEDWTNIRTSVMQAVQLETHQVPTGKIDVGRVMQNANEVFASMIIMKPKREDK